MGELILCNERSAEVPFYMEAASVNLYSIEELCYYVEQNLYLLGRNFMSEALCAWVEQELGMKETAGKLRGILAAEGSLTEFVTAILSSCGYCAGGEAEAVTERLREIEYKSESECAKLRADRYLENGMFAAAIGEYRRLLKKWEEDPLLSGNLWHNMGTAYARLFQFGEAVSCFERAYGENRNIESLRECLLACLCLRDEEMFLAKADLYEVSTEERAALKRRYDLAGDTRAERAAREEIGAFGEKIADYFKSGQKQEAYRILDAWRENYRRSQAAVPPSLAGQGGFS